MKNKKNLLFVVANHGDELIGVKVINKFKNNNFNKIFDILIGNPKALYLKTRFVESDLNRVFPGKSSGTYEEKIAKKIIKISKNYKEVIDLHGSKSKTGIFIIITKLTKKNLYLALRLNIKRIVIWQNTKETKGSLSTFMPSGLEVESGFKDAPAVEKRLEKILKNFLMNYNKSLDYKKSIKDKEIFEVIGKLERKNKKPKYLKNWKKIKNYYPLFVGGQYNDIWCYKLKKISPQICLKMIK